MSPSQPPSEREERVDEAIAAYLEAVEQGRGPDEREYLTRYPELSEELQAFFENRRRFAAAAVQYNEGPWKAGPPDLVEKVASFLADNGPIPAPVAGPDPVPDPGPTPRSEAATLPEAAPAAAGTRVRYFGDYELLDEVAKGGMGVVWRARQVSLNRTVALKMILAGQFASAAAVQRFRLEAEAAANLDHPGIVPIYEVGDHGGEQYYTMKLIEGTSLARSLAAGQWQATTPDAQVRIAGLVVAVARAVHHAHQRGILHRDLKPGNILLDRAGQPHVTDFGLAKRANAREHLPRDPGTPGSRIRGPGPHGTAIRSMTLAGEVVGTPSYMPPEQAASRKDLTVAADVYSLGAILYELLTGRPPFRGATDLETLIQVMEAKPPRPAKFAPTVAADLEAVCLKCLEKDPDRRYVSAEALAADLERWLAHQPVEARKHGVDELVKMFFQRQGRVAVVGTIVVVWTLFLPLLLVLLSQSDAARPYVQSFVEFAIPLLFVLFFPHFRFTFPDLVPGSPGYRLELTRRALDAFSPLPRMAFSPDGRRLAVAAAGQPIKILDGANGKEAVLLGRHEKKVTALAFSPDGSRLASAAWDRTVRLWRADGGTNPYALIRLPASVQSLLFRPDGTLLAGACTDGIVRIWDPADGRQINTRSVSGPIGVVGS